MCSKYNDIAGDMGGEESTEAEEADHIHASRSQAKDAREQRAGFENLNSRLSGFSA